MKDLLMQLLANNLGSLVTAVVVGVLGLYHLLSKASATEQAQRESDIQWAVSLAYKTVNEVHLRFPGKIVDKAAEGLRLVNEALSKKGQEPLSPDEAAQAKMSFTAMHGAELTQAKLVAAVPQKAPAQS